MPPKGARGAARGRGPGRGRGRGTSIADTPPVAAPEANETDSQSTIVDSDMPDVVPAANTTPVHEQEQSDPNASPATQPTETPAPTPVRHPTTNGAAASGSGSRETGVPKPSKFKPRIIRAGAKEREEREARERERENARLGAVAAAAAKESRIWGNRGRSSRGRGDAMGRGRGVLTGGTASGPFAVAPPVGDKPAFLSGGGGGASKYESAYSRGLGSGATGLRVKTESGGISAGSLFVGSHDPVAGQYIPEPQYPNEDDDAPRVDIEHINLASDSDDDVIMTGVGRSRQGKGIATNNLKPIRLDRKEHKERVTIVNTEITVKQPDPEDEDPAIMVVDEGRSSKAVPHQREWKGTYDNEAQIKTEPGITPLISYSRAPAQSPPPPVAFKAPLEIGADDPEFEMEINAGRAEPLPRPAKQRYLSKKKKKKVPVLQTEEDRAEWERHVEDMDVLRSELVGLATHSRSQNKGKDVEGDIEMLSSAEEPKEMEDGRIYLFQFPPVLPKLFDSTTSSNPNLKDDDMEVLESLDLTKDPKIEIKTEEKVLEIKHEEMDPDEDMRRKAREEALVVEEGMIGKLVIRESGQVELVWGGTNMKVSRWVETSFFSMGAVVDGLDQWALNDKEQVGLGGTGIGHAMGGIMGKFVVTPNWADIN